MGGDKLGLNAEELIEHGPQLIVAISFRGTQADNILDLFSTMRRPSKDFPNDIGREETGQIRIRIGSLLYVALEDDLDPLAALHLACEVLDIVKIPFGVRPVAKEQRREVTPELSKAPGTDCTHRSNRNLSLRSPLYESA